MKRLLYLLSLFICFSSYAQQDVYKPYAETVKKMTLEEKISMIHAAGKFCNSGVSRLGIPELWTSDGPHGVREEIQRHSWAPAGWTNDSSTYLPTLTTLASTWNIELAYKHGVTLGNEANARKKNIILGPGINIHRTPLGGRNFEYMSEDPFLISKMVVPYIRGVQTQGVAACVKHFAMNNQEYQRSIVNVECDERTLREIYLPGFEAAVKEAGVLAVMGAYNKFRGQFCCHNDYLLNRILRQEWGFKGLVMSDWDGTHNTIEAANNGLDLEMGTERAYNNYYMADTLAQLVKRGVINEELINEKVSRILYVMHQTFSYKKDVPVGVLNDPSHGAVALEIAREAAVLLKNEKEMLPLNLKKVKTIAIIGDNAIVQQSHGGQSSEIKAKYEITPLQGLKNKMPKGVKLVYAKGYKHTEWKKDSAAVLDQNLLNEAIEVAKKADYVIFVGGLNHDYDTESRDKPNMKLPYFQNEVISALYAVNPKIVVVMVNGSPVEFGDWLDKVPSVLQTCYSGSESGNAIAEVLLGKVNPSGKLPTTYPVKLEQSPAHALGEYPGVNTNVRYNEGILVGYRYFDTKNIAPRFCFGYGLSYTTFEYKNINLPSSISAKQDSVELSFDLTNSGKYEGKEVAQVYVREINAKIARPDKELKGFSKVNLKPGETKKIIIKLDKRAFQYFDANTNQWTTDAATFEILIGSSSRDIRLSAKTEMNK